MKQLKGWILTGVFAVTVLFGSTNVNAGIIFGSGLTETKTGSDPCTVNKEDPKIDWGIIFGSGLAGTGIIFGSGLAGTGIIVTDITKQTEPVNCGIIVTD